MYLSCAKRLVNCIHKEYLEAAFGLLLRLRNIFAIGDGSFVPLFEHFVLFSAVRRIACISPMQYMSYKSNRCISRKKCISLLWVIGDGSFVPLFEHFVLFCVVTRIAFMQRMRDKTSRCVSLKKYAGLLCERYLLAVLLLCNKGGVLSCVKFLSGNTCRRYYGLFRPILHKRNMRDECRV